MWVVHSLPGTGGGYDAGMRWLLVPLMVAVVALSGAGAAWVSSSRVAPDQVAPPSALVLVERLTTDEALAATRPGRPEVAGFVSTLPVQQPLASRVLSLAAGRRVDAMDALEANPAAASGMPDPGTVERIRADNPRPGSGGCPDPGAGLPRAGGGGAVRARAEWDRPRRLGRSGRVTGRSRCGRGSCWCWPFPTRPPLPT